MERLENKGKKKQDVNEIDFNDVAGGGRSSSSSSSGGKAKGAIE